MKVSVVIPCKNEQAVLGRLLESLAFQSEKATQIIVVDSGSTDTTVAVAKSFAERLPLNVTAAREKGVAHARNAGLAEATGDLIVFVDADIVLPQDFLARSIAQITRRKLECGAFTQRMNSQKAGLRLGAHFMNGYARLMEHTPWPIGFSCLFATKKAADKLEGFDPKLYIMEDYDFVLRGRRAGFTTGIVTVPFIGSDRRFVADDAPPVWQGIYGELYRYTHGLKVTKPIYDYTMGGKAKD